MNFKSKLKFPATCDFENEKCTWKNVQSEDTFDWIIGQGSTPTILTGPSSDHSKQNGDGWFFFQFKYFVNNFSFI